MSTQTAMDLSDLAVEQIEVVPAHSLDSASYGHGMSELAASSTGEEGQPFPSFSIADNWDWADV